MSRSTCNATGHPGDKPAADRDQAHWKAPMPPVVPPCPQAAQTPVFVDDTGRRHRLVRLVGWVVGGLTLAYLALLGVSLIGSPGLVPLSLPAIGRVLPDPSAPQIGTATKVGRSPRDQPSATPADASRATVVAGGPISAQPPLVTAPAPRRSPSAAPTPAPSSPAHAPKGAPSPAATPTAAHSPSSHRSPKSSHGSPRSVKGTPTPSPS